MELMNDHPRQSVPGNRRETAPTPAPRRSPPPMITSAASRAANRAPSDLQEALRPIASLIGKSEKARRKLAPGSWQRRMLRDNLRALRIASALMSKNAGKAGVFAKDDLREALRALASMAGKTEKAQAAFPPGTSPHTLQRNRLKALRMAEAAVNAELAARRAPEKKVELKFDSAGVDWRFVSDTLKRVGMANRRPGLLRQAFAASAIVVFAYVDGKPVGFGRAISDGAYQAAVYEMAVVPEFQRQGIGAKIMRAILARLPGCNVILYASPGKEDFYRKLGLRRMKTGMARFQNAEAMAALGFTD